MVQSPDDRRSVALQSRFLLLLFVVGPLEFILSPRYYCPASVWGRPLSLVEGAMLIPLVYAWRLNRRGRYMRSAFLVSILVSFIIFAVLSMFSAKAEAWPLFYLIFPVIWGAMFLSARHVAWLIAANTLGLLAVPWIYPSISYNELPVVFFLFNTLLLLLTVSHLNRLERMRQRELAESRERYRRLTETLFEGIAIESDGRLREVNPGFAGIVGLPVEELPGRSLSDFIPGWTSGGPGTGETLAIRASGAVVHVEYSTTATPDGQVIALRDISERKRAELERARLYTAIDQGSEGIIIAGANGAIEYVNRTFLSISANTPEDALGMDLIAFLEQNAAPGELDGLRRAMQRGQSWSNRITHGHGVSQHTLDLSLASIRSAGPEIVNFILSAKDITHEVQLEQQYRQSQKMEAIGHLAGGVAHDFNNLLQAIQGYTDMAMMDLPSEMEACRHLEEVMKAAERAAHLVQQLLTFSRREAMQGKNIDLAQSVAEITKMLRRVLGEHIDLHTVSGPRLRNVYADPNQVDQVIMNLCVNARDAMPEGGSIRIETANALVDAAMASRHPEAHPGNYVRLTVTDTGSGMPQEILDHIFEPFFTTKELGRGTGLGLATVYGVVRQHEGFIDVKSEPGRGSEFSVYFPAPELASQSQSPEAPAAEAPGGAETILFAEDEELVRNMISTALCRAGYQVILARDGEEAIQLYEQHADRISLVLLDVVMPKRNGRAVAEHIKARHPGVPIIYSTGYDFNLLGIGLCPPDQDHVIHKPYSSRDLLQRVRAVLDSAQER